MRHAPRYHPMDITTLHPVISSLDYSLSLFDSDRRNELTSFKEAVVDLHMDGIADTVINQTDFSINFGEYMLFLDDIPPMPDEIRTYKNEYIPEDIQRMYDIVSRTDIKLNVASLSSGISAYKTKLQQLLNDFSPLLENQYKILHRVHTKHVDVFNSIARNTQYTHLNDIVSEVEILLE